MYLFGSVIAEAASARVPDVPAVQRKVDGSTTSEQHADMVVR